MTAPNEATARWIIDRCNSLLGSMTSMPNGLSDPVLNIKIGRLFEVLREVREHFCSKLEEYNVQ